MGILPGFGKTAFHGLFDHCALQHDWTLVPEWGKRSPHTSRDLESALALDTSLNNFIDWLLVMPYAWASMSLYQHPLFTIDLNKVIAVYQNEDDAAVTIRTDDQRKIEVATASQEEAAEFLNEFADQWEKAVGPLLRHDKYVFLTAAMYSIQAEGEEVYIYFRDHSVSFPLTDSQQALGLLAELTRRWQAAIEE